MANVMWYARWAAVKENQVNQVKTTQNATHK